MSKRLTTLEFIDKSQKLHNNKYDYRLSNYINNHTKITIICPIHGEFHQRPLSHLSGIGCKKCGVTKRIRARSLSTNDFILNSVKVHGDAYDYSNVEYINARSHVNILCKKCNKEFLQKASVHVKGHGCPKCATNKVALKKTSNTKDFILKSIAKHENKYDYSLVNYSKKNLNIKIICPIHGKFQQRPDNHLDGKGCAKCSTGRGWKKSDWIEFCNNKNVNPIVYIVRCFSENESFIKVGMTSNSVNHRFKSIPYSYEIVKEIKGSPDFIWNKEKEIHNAFSKSKYIPMITFEGRTECFDLSILQHLKD